VGDMPGIGPESYRVLAAEFTQGSIIVPLHRRTRGHPVLFCASYVPELSALSGDEGARSLLRRHALRVGQVEITNPGAVRDVDTREDFDCGQSDS